MAIKNPVFIPVYYYVKVFNYAGRREDCGNLFLGITGNIYTDQRKSSGRGKRIICRKS
jgi:hypothetical protein